jgi:hypothetical protein
MRVFAGTGQRNSAVCVAGALLTDAGRGAGRGRGGGAAVTVYPSRAGSATGAASDGTSTLWNVGVVGPADWDADDCSSSAEAGASKLKLCVTRNSPAIKAEVSRKV